MTEEFEDSQALRKEIAAYISDVLGRLASPISQAESTLSANDSLADEIFSIVTSRAFCYLSRKRVECYRQQVVASIDKRIRSGEPLRFFYDIGPGYHATTRPGKLPLRYDVGLSELLILAQVHALCTKVAEVYHPGARFWFVVDNLCALRTNDIPVENTEGYVAKLRRLIDSTGSAATVDLIVESEVFDIEEYDRLLSEVPEGELLAEPSPVEIDNISRFLGRLCTPAETAMRIERYGRTSVVTDRLVDELVNDVHMTQRATGATLGFRPFSGGDQRTQTGELVLTRGSKGKLRPVLLTTRNVDAYECLSFKLEEVLPAPVPYITFAYRVDS